MVTFTGDLEDFNKFIGPKARNIVQNETRAHKKKKKKCEECEEENGLQAAAIYYMLV